jgi:hypothetical protein
MSWASPAVGGWSRGGGERAQPGVDEVGGTADSPSSALAAICGSGSSGTGLMTPHLG